MKIIDDNNKRLHWWNRNYFFATTIAVALINIILFGVLGNAWEKRFGVGGVVWEDLLNFRNIGRAFLNSFSHINWQHVLLNMLCFFIAGLYLERKEGTIPFLVLVLTLTFFSSLAAATANKGGAIYSSPTAWHGFSCANFALYAYILVDYVFTFRKSRRSKFNIISGAVVLALIYLSMCSNGEWFTWYPRNLMENAGHYTGYLTGLIVGLLLHACRWKTEREMKS